MELGLEGRNALVTGASSGLGLGGASALAREGASVAICARNDARLESAVAALSRLGEGRIVGIVGDVSKPGEPERLVRDAERALGPLSILVANAGGPPAGSILDLEESQWREA